MGSDTIAGAVDRRDGPAFSEDRPYGRPRRSSPWPWPITPSRRAARPATTASRSESHRRGGLDTVRQWAWERPCVDPSGVIRVHTLTEETGDDATLALDRLTAVKGPLARVTADAASDTVAIDETARARGATARGRPRGIERSRWSRRSAGAAGSRGQGPIVRAGWSTRASATRHHRRGPSRPESSQAGECGRPRLCDPESDDRLRPTRVISPRPVRILSVGIVRARFDLCTNACAGKARSRGTRCRDVIFEALFDTLWVSNPIRPRSAASRNRVMRGPGVTPGRGRRGRDPHVHSDAEDIVTLTKSSSIDPQDTGLQPVANPSCWASKTAANLNLTMPARTPRITSPCLRLRTFPLPVAPPRANVDGHRLPAAATTRRNRVHDPARDRLDHHLR